MNPKASGLATVAILFLVVSLFVVALRVYVRAHLIKGFGSDDTAIVITMALYSLYIAFVLSGIPYGTGEHMKDITHEHASLALRNWWICELFYVASTAVLKIAIGIFLLRITVKKIHIYVVWATMALSIATGLVLFLFCIFQCSPSSSFWSVTGARARDCLNPELVTNMTYAHAAIICIIDCTFGAIPVILVWNLQMNLASKISLGFILCLGAIGCIASFVRLKSIEQIGASSDFLYSTVDLAIWSTIEPGVGITAASLATLRPLFRSFFGKGDASRSNPPLTMPRLRSDYVRAGGDGGGPAPPKSICVSTTITSTVRPWEGEESKDGSNCEVRGEGSGSSEGSLKEGEVCYAV
ncbi:hypothetical protein MMC30_003942 [Trapelia coarctata]|nr:hypothetical protein [Trapelia coarctata]